VKVPSFFDGLEVDRHDQGRADLVLAAVAPADGPASFVEHRVLALQLLVQGPGARDELGLVLE